jgi:hypothetical protein
LAAGEHRPRARPVLRPHLLISWALWAPLVSARLDGREAPTWLHLAGSLGPAIAALLTAAILYGRRTTATLLRALSPAHLGRLGAAVAIGGPLLLLAAGSTIIYSLAEKR